jgi:hypothetical protein
MQGERILFVHPLPDGSLIHLALWTLTAGRRRVVELTATLVPVEGAPDLATVHYPGWMLKTHQPDHLTTVLSLGPSELALQPIKNIVNLRIAARGFGFRTQIIARTDRGVSERPLLNGETPMVSMIGDVKGLCGVHGHQAMVEGPAAWESLSFDLGRARRQTERPSPGFARLWFFGDDGVLAGPGGAWERGGPVVLGGIAQKELMWAKVERRVEGALPGRVDLHVGDRCWSLTSTLAHDGPLIGFLPFSSPMERRLRARALGDWRLRLHRVSSSEHPGAGLCEEWMPP